MKNEINSMKKDISKIQTQIVSVKSDIRHIQEDVSELKSDTKKTSNDVAKINGKLDLVLKSNGHKVFKNGLHRWMSDNQIIIFFIFAFIIYSFESNMINTFQLSIAELFNIKVMK